MIDFDEVWENANVLFREASGLTGDEEMGSVAIKALTKALVGAINKELDVFMMAGSDAGNDRFSGGLHHPPLDDVHSPTYNGSVPGDDDF